MHVRARHLILFGSAATLALACSSRKTAEPKKVELTFTASKTALEPPTGHKQKLCVTARGSAGAEFGMYNIPEGDEDPTPFQVVGKPQGTFKSTMPAAGQVTVCYDVSEQGAGQLVHRVGAELTGASKKDVKIKYTRPPYIKFRDVRMWFTGFEDRTWSMGYEKIGRMNLTIPPGTRITVGKQTTVSDKTDIFVSLPMASKARDLALADILGGSDKEVKVAIRIQLPDSSVHKGALELTVGKHFKDWLGAALSGVVKGPVTFAGEPAAPTTRSFYYKGKVLGPAKKIAEITHVLVREDRDRKRKCGDFGVSTQDWTFKIYDRRTGKRIQAKVFKGKIPACPKKGGPTGETDSRPDEAAVKKWIKGLKG